MWKVGNGSNVESAAEVGRRRVACLVVGPEWWKSPASVPCCGCACNWEPFAFCCSTYSKDGRYGEANCRMYQSPNLMLLTEPTVGRPDSIWGQGASGMHSLHGLMGSPASRATGTWEFSAISGLPRLRHTDELLDTANPCEPYK